MVAGTPRRSRAKGQKRAASSSSRGDAPSSTSLGLFADLSDAAVGLVQTALRIPTGARAPASDALDRAPAVAVLGETERRICTYVNQRKLLVSRARELEGLREVLAELRRSGLDEALEEEDGGESEEALQRLQEEVLTAQESAYNSGEQLGRLHLLVDRLQENRALLSAVFGSDTPDPIRRLLVHRDNKVSEALRIHERLRAAQEEIDTLRAERSQLITECRQLAARLESKDFDGVDDAAAPSEDAAEVVKRVHALRVRNQIIRSMFQGLVFESRVNWSKDERLAAVVMRLEDFPVLDGQRGGSERG